MVIIGPRDVNILKILSSGAVLLDDLQDLLSMVVEKDPILESSKLMYSNKMSKRALYLRLVDLRDDNFIQSQRYAHRHGKGVKSLYALAEDGVQELVSRGIPRTHIHNTLPYKTVVAHELQLVSCIRAIKKEAKTGVYEYEFIDENNLRSTDGMTKIKRRGYPDLLVTLRMHASKTEILTARISFELDNDTIYKMRVAEKLYNVYRDFDKRTIIVVCPVSKRIDNLKDSLESFCARIRPKLNPTDQIDLDKFIRKVFFAPVGMFTSKGFIGTKWVNSAGQVMEIAPNPKK